MSWGRTHDRKPDLAHAQLEAHAVAHGWLRVARQFAKMEEYFLGHIRLHAKRATEGERRKGKKKNKKKKTKRAREHWSSHNILVA